MQKTEEKQPLNKKLARTKRLAKLKRVPPFPGTKQSNKFTIVYAVDTSGSMSNRDLQLGLSELQQIQKSDSDVTILVMYSDAALAHEYKIGATDKIDFSVKGRGGTDFEPVFERVLELMRSSEDAPDVLIYATDGYAPPPSIRLSIPVVWLITPTGIPVCTDAGHITLKMQDFASGEDS
jgi:predicted metal-dependent peptidase